MSEGNVDGEVYLNFNTSVDSYANNFSSYAAPIAPAYTQSWFETFSKRVFDLGGALVLIAVFAPLIIAIVFLLRRSGGPVIYRHRRVGFNGQVFECLKFRTMVPHAEQRLAEVLESDVELKSEWLEHQKLRNDPRVTPIGRFLRKT